MNKTAVVTGASGQTGSYLIECLLDTNQYKKVYGLVRRSSRSNDNMNSFIGDSSFELIEGDITDSSLISSLIGDLKPHEYYNLGAQSHVHTSFEEPFLTLDANGYAVLNALDAIKRHSPDTRFLQASTSEMFGNNGIQIGDKLIQNEETPLSPRSPYGAAKIYAHNMVKVYRESYNLFACASICFNHDSSRRPIDFVTRKITNTVAQIKFGLKDKIKMGMLSAKRDIGHASDYVRAMHLMLNNNKPVDYVIATGHTISIREMLEYVCGLANLNVHDIYELDERFVRPSEVYSLCGDASKIKQDLNWSPIYTWQEILSEMYDEDYQFYANKVLV